MKFGELLKEYIEKQGHTTMGLAKKTTVSRTLLTSIYGGKHMTMENFKLVVRPDFFTPSQIRDLSNLYFKEEFGEAKFNEITEIRRGLNGELKKELAKICHVQKPDFDITSDTVTFSGKSNLASVAARLVRGGSIDFFASNFAFSQHTISRLVYRACKKNKIKSFFHCVCPDLKNSVNNIESVFYAVYFAQAGYITTISNNSGFNTFMPYFIISDNYLLIYDEACENGSLIKLKDGSPFYDFVHTQIEKIKFNSTQSVRVNENAFEFMNLMDTSIPNPDAGEFKAFDNEICPVFLTPEVGAAVAGEALKNIPTVFEAISSHYDLIGAKAIDTMIVTYKALNDYLNSGIIHTFPKALSNPVPKELRSQLVKPFCDESHVNNFRILNPNMFSSDLLFSLELNKNRLFLGFPGDEDSPENYVGKVSLYSDESDILNAFNNFFDYVQISNTAYSKQVSANMLKRASASLSLGE